MLIAGVEQWPVLLESEYSAATIAVVVTVTDAVSTVVRVSEDVTIAVVTIDVHSSIND